MDVVEANHYQVLGLRTDATQAEIKQAYRKLAKQFHPDRFPGVDQSANHDRIVAINVAYEVLGDLKRRQDYDCHRFVNSPRSHRDGRSPTHDQTRSDPQSDREQRTATAQSEHRRRQSAVTEDDRIREWLEEVYRPIDRAVMSILKTYQAEINALAADPFDDQLLEDFQTYLEQCNQRQSQAEKLFQSCANPAKLAQFAATLYYCLSHIGDGLKELGYFTTSYDENYLHTGREMFRLAAQLRREIHLAQSKI
jgi:molecular chaperone DnaJ